MLKETGDKMDALNKFLIKHSHQLSAVESSIRTLTYILPGRFEDADLASEGLYAALNLIGMYYDIILEEKFPHLLSTAKTSQFNRYTRWLHTTNGNHCNRVLALIQFTEVVAEMIYRKRVGDASNFIVAVEGVKFVLKLVILNNTQRRMLLRQFVPERDLEQAQFEDVEVKESLPIGDIDAYLSQKALDGRRRKPTDLVKPLQGERLISEILFHSRPLLYTLIFKKYGPKSWIPWATSLIVDLVALAMARKKLSWLLVLLLNKGGQHVPEPKHSKLTQLERDEQQRRFWLLIFYLLRNPFFDTYTKQKLLAICNSADRLPIVSLFTNILKQYLPLWEKVYFYTSAS